MRNLKALVALAAMLSGTGPALAGSVSCQCQAAFVCSGGACQHFSGDASSCFTFKLTYDRPEKKIRLCRDAMCEEGRMSVEKTSDGQLILRTSIKWGGQSGGEGTWIMIDDNAGFVYRQKGGQSLEVISGPCE
jgi:hypothetical protein